MFFFDDIPSHSLSYARSERSCKIVRLSVLFSHMRHVPESHERASPRQNISSGFQTKRVSNQAPQLQRLARKFEISPVASVHYDTFQKAKNTDADQTVRMRSLVCPCVDRKPLKTGFLASRPKWHIYKLYNHNFKQRL